MYFMNPIHVKVRWASFAAALTAAVTAFTGFLGVHPQAWMGAALAAVAAFVGGYAAPSGEIVQDPEAGA